MKKFCLIIFLLFFFTVISVFSKKIAEFSELFKPEMMEVYKNEIYIVDGSSVKVFSLRNNRYIRKFGKKGSGPGELFVNQDYHIHLQIINNYVYLNSRNKIIKYSLAGKMIEERTFRLLTWQIIPFGRNFAVVKFGTVPNRNRILSALIVYPDSRIRKKLYSFEYGNPNKTMKFPLIPNLLLVRPYRNYIYVFDRKNGFPMRVYSQQGDLVNKIFLELPKIPVDEKFKDDVWDWLELNKKWKRKKSRQIRMVFPEYFPCIKNFLIKNDKIYCQTYKKNGERSEFIILDLQGNIIRRKFLPHADGNKMDLWTQFPFYAIHNSKYYYLLENLENDTWELHIINIKGIMNPSA